MKEFLQEFGTGHMRIIRLLFFLGAMALSCLIGYWLGIGIGKGLEALLRFIFAS